MRDARFQGDADRDDRETRAISAPILLNATHLAFCAATIGDLDDREPAQDRSFFAARD